MKKDLAIFEGHEIRRLEQDFLKKGGLRERMTRARIQARDQQRSGPPL